MRKKLPKMQIVIQPNRNYILQEAANITGLTTDELQRRCRTYQEVSRVPLTGQVYISGRTIDHILTAQGTKWRRRPLGEEHQ